MESQQERVLVYLRDLILKGEFAPGERLGEVALAERLKASRTPVRRPSLIRRPSGREIP